MTFRLLVAGTATAACTMLIGPLHELHLYRSTHAPLWSPPPITSTVTVIGGDVIDSLATVVSDHDPFRVSHEPSTVPYTPDRPSSPGAPPPTPKPSIVVTGIIGPPWAAVLEGVQGHDGDWVSKVGDTLSKTPFVVTVLRRITRDTVTVGTSDTTWKLTVRSVWR